MPISAAIRMLKVGDFGGGRDANYGSCCNCFAMAGFMLGNLRFRDVRLLPATELRLPYACSRRCLAQRGKAVERFMTCNQTVRIRKSLRSVSRPQANQKADIELSAGAIGRLM